MDRLRELRTPIEEKTPEEAFSLLEAIRTERATVVPLEARPRQKRERLQIADKARDLLSTLNPTQLKEIEKMFGLEE